MWKTLAGLLLLAAGCGDGRPSPVPSAEAGRTWALAVDVPFAELEIPEDSRLGAPPPEDVAVLGEWKLVRGSGAARVWRTELPVRPRSLFFFRPPEGMALLDSTGEKVRHGSGRPSWEFTAETLTLTLPKDASAPVSGAYKVRYPFATEREAALNHRFSGVPDEADFVRTRVQSGPDSYAGLLLPAPGKAAWRIDVPAAAELTFKPGLVPPETQDARPSDGVTLSVSVEVDGQIAPVWSETRTSTGFGDGVRLDLSRWAGQQVLLRFETDPGASPRFDYAFFADPIVASRKSDPKRVVMVFVDTVRADHLGVYGYERDTSAPLDAWAQDAVVFEQARSVAPWTLPTTRAVLTGRQPEFFEAASTLQGRLREQGWATAFMAGNVYLSSNFDMDRDWGRHFVVRAPKANEQVDRSLAWLEEQDGRDALLLLHFMDAHLPYDEPRAYRNRYAKEGPERLKGKFERGTVVRAQLKDPADRQYVRDRYDNNLAFIHDELARVLSHLDDRDVVVYFADHGEEFWDHGGFEHGHTLFDELLRVPLIVKAPDLPAGRVDVPVSLLDVTPTVLDVLGLPTDGLDGASLAPLARGDSDAKTALSSRDIAFGRPLYGTERWGVLHDGQKYTTNEGREALYDLGKDPGERENLLGDVDGAPGAEWRERLGAALGREVLIGWRLDAQRVQRAPKEDLVVEMSVPGGVRAAWVGDDPTQKSSAEVHIDGERVRATWHAGYAGSREIFVIPTAPMEQVTHEVVVSLPGGATLEVPDNRDAGLGTVRTPLARTRVNGRMVMLGYAIGVAPADGAVPTVASDAELKSALEALGYAFDDEEEPPAE